MEQINKDNFKELLTIEEINNRIKEMALEIDRDYEAKDIISLSRKRK